MGKPKTPFVGCDVFVTNEKNEVLLIQRVYNNYGLYLADFTI